MCHLKTKWDSIALKARWSICLSVVAIILAVVIRLTCPGGLLAHLFISVIGLFPPIWFIWEWANDPRGANGTKLQQEELRHEQNLARNVWIALFAVISVITGVVGFK